MLAEHMKALSRWLERTGTTQTAFADEMGVKQPTVSGWINGVNSASAVMLKKIARRTGLTVDELLADVEPVRSRAEVITRHVR